MNRIAAWTFAFVLGIGPWAPLVAGDAPANSDPVPKSPMAGPPPMVHKHYFSFYDPALSTTRRRNPFTTSYSSRRVRQS